jgi:hypothetical protein
MARPTDQQLAEAEAGDKLREDIEQEKKRTANYAYHMTTNGLTGTTHKSLGEALAFTFTQSQKLIDKKVADFIKQYPD